MDPVWPTARGVELAALPPSRQLEAGADLPSPVPLLGVTRGKAFGALMVRFIAFGRSSSGGLVAGRRDEAAIAATREFEEFRVSTLLRCTSLVRSVSPEKETRPEALGTLRAAFGCSG